MPSGVPLRAGEMSIVTTSPRFTLVFFQPMAMLIEGEPISTAHSTGSLPLPGTSSWMKECGLVHCTSFTVPLMVCCLV